MAIEFTLGAFRDAIVYEQTLGLSARIRTGGALDIAERIAIYRNNRQQTLLAAMAKQYPVTKQVVGEDCFNQLCLRYHLHHPADHYDLDAHGTHLADFLETIDEVKAQTPYLADLSRLEFALVQSYYARDRCDFDTQTLLAVAADQQSQVVFHLAADVIPLRFSHNVHRLWQQHQQERHHQGYVCSAINTHLVIAREAFKPQTVAVNYSEMLLLNAIQERKTVAQLLGLSEFDEVNLIALLNRGWIDGFHVAA